MKRHAAAIVMLVLSLWAANTHAEISVSSGMRFDMFGDGESPETLGYEVTLPLSVSTAWKGIQFTLKTNYSRANVYPAESPDAKLDGLTDTALSASYGVTNLPIGRLALSIDLNLPTGRERLSNLQKQAEAGNNHDLFEVDNFGEGWNTGVSLGFSGKMGKLALGLNGKYTLMGAYDPTADIDQDDLDPGDQIVVNSILQWQASQWLTLEALAAYAHVGVDTINGADAFQDGDKLTVGGMVRILTHWHRTVRIVASFQQTFQTKNTVLTQADTLDAEPQNSNGRKFFGTLEVMYEHSPRLALRLLTDIRYYGESDRQDDIQEVPFEGKRVRYAFGPGLIYTPSRRWSFNALGKYFHMNQEPDIFLRDANTLRGINLSVGLTYKFGEL